MSWRMSCEYPGFIDDARDKGIKEASEALGGKFLGSGCMLGDCGGRDVCFDFPTEWQAKRAEKAVKGFSVRQKVYEAA